MKNFILTFVFSSITVLTFSQYRLLLRKNYSPNTTDAIVYSHRNGPVINGPIVNGSTIKIYNIDVDTVTTIENWSGDIQNLNNDDYTYLRISNNGVSFNSNDGIDFIDFRNDSLFMKVSPNNSVDGNTYIFNINFKPYFDLINNNASTNKIEVNPLNVFPNPVNDILNISINGTQNIVLSDLNGRIIFSDTIHSNHKIDLSNQPNGIYILQIDNQFHKIVKQ